MNTTRARYRLSLDCVAQKKSVLIFFSASAICSDRTTASTTTTFYISAKTSAEPQGCLNASTSGNTGHSCLINGDAKLREKSTQYFDLFLVNILCAL